MEDRAYLLAEARRYFRLAQAKSDPVMAANLEAMAQCFMARAEAAEAESQKSVGAVDAGDYSPFVVGLNLKAGGSVLDRIRHRAGR